MNKEELKKHFEANMLDGDEIQSGQMLSSESMFEYVIELLGNYTPKVESHWYDSNSGRGDSYKYHCACGFARFEKEKLLSHITWKLAELSTTKHNTSKE